MYGLNFNIYSHICAAHTQEKVKEPMLVKSLYSVTRSGAESSNLKCLDEKMVELAVPFYGLRFRIFESEFSNPKSDSDILPIQ